MKLEIRGEIIGIKPVKDVTPTFTVQEIIVHTEEKNGEYLNENEFPIQVVKKGIDELREFKVGDIVTCHCNVRGKTYVKDFETKGIIYFSAWKIER